jgi:hypothetical protein
MTTEQWATLSFRILYLGVVLFCTYRLGGWYWTGIVAGGWGLLPTKAFR